MIFKAEKGQLSIFIVISAILVIGLIALFSFSPVSVPIFSDSKPSASVKSFIDSCIERESEEAIRTIALHGGWLYGPETLYATRDSPEELVKQSEGFSYLDRVDMTYWFYFDDSDEQFKLNIPEYNTANEFSIRGQLETYVQENIEGCLDNFQAYKGLYNVVVDEEVMDVNVRVSEGENVIVELTMPTQITEISTNITEEVTSYRQTFRDKLWVPYNLARDITLAQADSSFLELRMMQFLAPYQTTESRDLLPPFYEFKIDYDFNPWDLREVETLISSIISSHLMKVQFLNTDYRVDELDSELQGSEFARALNELYTKDYISETSATDEDDERLFGEYRNYQVTPTYEPFFPSFISVSPSMGGQILLPRPQAVISFLPFFFTEYVAVYEMTLPVVIEIQESGSRANALQFNVPIETNIDFNKPLRENLDFSVDLSEIDLSQNKALICDPPQFISEYVYLNITDPIANGLRNANSPTSGVDGAVVSFDCKNIASCYVGETGMIPSGDGGTRTELSFRLPINCDPGTIEVYKAGHSTLTFDNINPTLTTPISLGEVFMPSKKELETSVKLVSPSASQFSEGRVLGEDETAFVILQHLEDETMIEVLEISSENQYELSVELLPGNYSVQGFVIYNNPITIPEEEICYQVGLFDEECQTLPQMDLDSWISGGIEIETFEITTSELLNRNELVIPLITVAIPRSYDTLSSTSDQLGSLDVSSVGLEPYLE